MERGWKSGLRQFRLPRETANAIRPILKGGHDGRHRDSAVRLLISAVGGLARSARDDYGKQGALHYIDPILGRGHQNWDSGKTATKPGLRNPKKYTTGSAMRSTYNHIAEALRSRHFKGLVKCQIRRGLVFVEESVN